MIDELDKKFRPCVGAMIINSNSKVWLGKRISKTNYQSENLWQMPQGGIDPDEDPEKAVLREVFEETGIKKLKIIAVSAHWYRYKIPKVILNNMKGDFIGQTQKWFLLYYEGDDSEIRLIPDNDSGLYQEFEDWKWENSKNVIDLVINFKKDTYIKVFKEFTDLGIL